MSSRCTSIMMIGVMTGFALVCLLSGNTAWAQESVTLRGTVVSVDTGQPLPGALVTVGDNSTLTGESGEFSIDVTPGQYRIKALAEGFQEWVQDIDVKPGVPLDLAIKLVSGEVIVIVDVGSRTQRTQLETPVPVDVISDETIARSGYSETNQVLAQVAPSYNATHQTISDGTDHINPASLRGLGPDQVLVLVNGKRRHSSALLNVNGTFGRGTVGTDLNSIPTAAIKRIEVLRDGASAQYGSDAIAGVVNVVLKDYTDIVDVTLRTGITGSGDGEELKTGLNWGYRLGEDGYINLTAEFLARGQTNRAGAWDGPIFPGITDPDETDAELAIRGTTREDYSMVVGQSAALVGMLYANASYPLTDDIDFYSFGGYTRRHGYASGFYRLPSQAASVDLTVYPDGFLPEINPVLDDWSLSAGLKGKSAGWDWDLSATHGGNSFHYFIENSINASLGASSPTSFDAGRLLFSQTTLNADLIRPIQVAALKSLSLVLGTEVRAENYRIGAGDVASYTFGPETYVDASGNELPKAPGAQVFPGFQPANEVDEWRSSQGAYAGLETQVSDKLLVDVAARFENYSDFGNAFNYKLAGRYALIDALAVRGAVSTGFRAPSLHQFYFNSISTQFVDNPATGTLEPKQVLTANNESGVAQAFGIPALQEETSLNMSAGFTATPMDNLSLTADFYRIAIDDRIVLTSQFAGDPNAEMSSIPYQVSQILAEFPDVSRAQFFTNAVDTTTQGVEVVATYNTQAGRGNLAITGSANFTNTEVTEVHVPQGVVEQFDADSVEAVSNIVFNREEENRLEDTLPRQKGTLGLRYRLDALSLGGRANYYGPVEYRANNPEQDEQFGAKVIFDVDAGYQIGKWRLSLGAINLFNTFPDEQQNPANISGNRFIYSRRVSQFGINGGFYYLRLQYMH